MTLAMPIPQTHEKAQNAGLAALSPVATALLKPHLTDHHAASGSSLWHAGAAATHAFFPLSGLISIIVPMSGGNGVEVANIGREAMACGWLSHDQFEARTDGIVSVGGTFGKIGREHLFAAAERSDEIARLLTHCQNWILTQSQQILACNTLHGADQRLSRWLLLCSQKLDTSLIVVTQERIAEMLGIRRTTLSLIAQGLAERKLIDYRRGKITILDAAKLRQAACECCTRLATHH